MCHGSAPTVVSDDRRGRNLGLSRFRPVQKVGGSCVHGLGPPRFNPSRANRATCAHQSPQTADLDRVPKYVPTSANLRVPGDTSEHLRARKTGGSHLPGRLAMQKVEGSSPFIRLQKPRKTGLFCSSLAECPAYRSPPAEPRTRRDSSQRPHRGAAAVRQKVDIRCRARHERGLALRENQDPVANWIRSVIPARGTNSTNGSPEALLRIDSTNLHGSQPPVSRS